MLGQQPETEGNNPTGNCRDSDDIRICCQKLLHNLVGQRFGLTSGSMDQTTSMVAQCVADVVSLTARAEGQQGFDLLQLHQPGQTLYSVSTTYSPERSR